MEKIKLLLYATKSKPYLMNLNTKYFISSDRESLRYIDKQDMKSIALNGYIVAECDFEVEKIRKYHSDLGEDDDKYSFYETTGKNILWEEELLKYSCLSYDELDNYLKGKNGYAIHIKNLHIFDKPKELSDFYRFDGFYNDINNWKYIDKAPQNMMYAYELISELGWSGTCNRHLEKKIIISIRPEYLVKILNKEKTIEVRKKVLKEMVK